MATATLPARQSASRSRWLTGAIALVVLGLIAALVITVAQNRAAPATVATVPVARGAIVASVAGSGTLTAARDVDLPFQASGSVIAVLVQEGDPVTAGQPMARLDDRELRLQVVSAEASLASAQARLAQAQAGNARPEEIAAAQASLANTAAQLTKVRTGNLTRADLASAEATLRAAQARLDALKNPTPDKTSAVRLRVSQAEGNLPATRDSASAAKTRAEQDVYRAADALTQAQSRYATALQNWQYVQDTGKDPINPTKTVDSKTVNNTLSDAQRQQYYDAFVQAEAAMRSAERAVQQAQVAYDTARQQEVVAVQQAEAQLADARQQLDALLHPSATDIVQAQAVVDQAQAQLTKLRQGGTAADIAAAQATIDQAQANLDKLTAPATATDLQIQQASVTQAEQALALAHLKLDQATLTAPFAGVVTVVRVVPGSTVTSNTPAISLIDRHTLYVDLKLSENDAAKVQPGQTVMLTIGALDGWEVQGMVRYVAPAAENINDVVTYQARVRFPDTDPRVKVGMTASLAIVTDRKAGVLLVPNTALMPNGAGHVVRVPNADGTFRDVDVQTGLTDGTQTEIVSGLHEGDAISATPATAIAPSGGGLLKMFQR